jgi:uridine kinase
MVGALEIISLSSFFKFPSVKKDCLIIGICGGSGSGKTTILEELMHLLKDHKPALLSLDNYYRDISEQQKDEQGHVNFDLPSAFDSDRFCQDLKRLKKGESLHIKKYQFNHRDREEYIDIPASKIILTEGIFLFNIPEVVEMIDVKIFVELDLDVQLQRRLQRDVRERGYDANAVLYQWENHVLPAYRKFIEVHKNEADIAVMNDGDKNSLVQQVDRYILSHPVVSEFCCSLSE